MGIWHHEDVFAGLRIHEVFDGGELDAEPLPEGDFAWRIASVFEGTHFEELLENFLAKAESRDVTHLIVGFWGASYDSHTADPAALLAAAASRIPELKALFLGDITGEESEISWIEQSDITGLFEAFPNLETLVVRGGQGLVVRPFRHGRLRELRFETGGLPRNVVEALGASDLPALERLELWLGVPQYGGDWTVADLAGILGGERLPALRHLGLQNSEEQDRIAEAVAGAPVVARLETLDLSMGTLTDAGGEALLSGQPLTHLRALDLSHHYLTDPMVARLGQALPGVAIDVSEQLKPERHGWSGDEDHFYVAVSE